MLTSGTIAERIADWAMTLRGEDLPPDVERRMRLLILDHVAVTMAGIQHGATTPVLDTVAPEHRPQGGRDPVVPIWGTGRTARLQDAVLVHGTAASALDFDDVHMGAGLHPGAACLPVILGIATERNLPFSETIAAAAMAYETMLRLGLAIFPESRNQGFHVTPVIGGIGAAAGAARLLGMTPAVVADAVALAAMNAGGLFSYRSRWIEPSRVQVGRVAREGLLCAELAARGTPGPRDVFENPDGFLNAFGGSAATADGIVYGLGTDWHLMKTEPKLYPFCKQAYGAIEASVELHRRLKPSDKIRSISVEATRTAAALPAERPRDGDAAVLSLRYAVASTLRMGAPGMGHLSDRALEDPDVGSLFHRIEVTESPALTRHFPPRTPASIVVTLDDGRQLEATTGGDGGLREPDLEAEGLARKFTELTTPVIGETASAQLWQAGQSTADTTFVVQLAALRPTTPATYSPAALGTHELIGQATT
ncbi:MmgE/PrpD family protein [Citricoccus zhacaiensis]